MRQIETGHYPIDFQTLPRNWAVVSVGDASTNIQPGFACGIHNQDGIGVPHIRPMNIDRTGRLDLAVVKYVSAQNELRLHSGEVLFNNTNSAELIGKTTYISTEMELAFSNHMTRLRPATGINPRFIAYQLHFLWMVGYFQHRCTHHVNQASVSSSTLAETVPLVVAPTIEQARIVAEIEKQLTRLDAAVSALKRVQANLKRYRASVLKAACEGRLVPTEAELARREGRSYEPASALLERIQVKSNQGGNYVGGLPEMPEGWSWTTLALLIAEGPQNGLYLPKTKYGSGTPILRIDDFQSHMSRASEELRLVNANKEEVALYSLRPGDMVVNRVNSPSHLGKTLFVENRNAPALFESNMMRMRLHESVSSEYVAIYLSSTIGRARLTARAKWAVNQASINQQDVGLTPIPLPPAAEQRRIAVEVSRQLSVLAEIQMQLATNTNRADKLRKSVLKRAFEGKLVPQDSKDEPASVLLERIRGTANRGCDTRALNTRGSRRKPVRAKETADV